MSEVLRPSPRAVRGSWLQVATHATETAAARETTRRTRARGGDGRTRAGYQIGVAGRVRRRSATGRREAAGGRSFGPRVQRPRTPNHDRRGTQHDEKTHPRTREP